MSQSSHHSAVSTWPWNKVLPLSPSNISHVAHWIQCSKCKQWRTTNISISEITTWKPSPHWQCSQNNTSFTDCSVAAEHPNASTHSAYDRLVLFVQRQITAIHTCSDEEEYAQHVEELCATIDRYKKNSGQSTLAATTGHVSSDKTLKHKLKTSQHEGPPAKKQKQHERQIASDADWSCSACTFLNKSSRERCEICYAAKVRNKNRIRKLNSDENLQQHAQSAATGEWPCSACTFVNKPHSGQCAICKTTKNGAARLDKQHLITIRLETHIISNDKKDRYSVKCNYSGTEQLQTILDPIIARLQRKYYPSPTHQLKVYKIADSNDQVHVDNVSLQHAITTFSEKQLLSTGLKITLRACYQHRVRNIAISCKYMKRKQTKNALQCPIYHALKEKHEHKEEYLAHLQDFHHFESDIDSAANKTECKYNEKCKAYVRCERGGNRLSDRCHMTLYRHPPRNRIIKLSANVRSFVLNTKEQQNQPLYEPTQLDRYKYKFTKRDRFLWALIDEVVRNGFRHDLCICCSKENECRHSEHSLLQVVDDKLRHSRHRAVNSPLSRDQMLALLLYTGCDCNYDLCASQRSGDFTKWKWFDYCLYFAIFQLSFREIGAFSVFSGLNGVKLDKKEVACGFFKTYQSTSWSKKVAMKFMQSGESKEGMLIEIEPKYKENGLAFCCDVSWISLFDECEVLFARSLDSNAWSKFKCVVVNDCDGVQHVKLSM